MHEIVVYVQLLLVDEYFVLDYDPLFAIVVLIMDYLSQYRFCSFDVGCSISSHTVFSYNADVVPSLVLLWRNPTNS